MIRIHGTPPCPVAAIHGGPGAAGTLGRFAAELHRRTGLGVAEPFQSRHSIRELVEELREQLAAQCAGGAVLIGHSWGALLSVFVAAQYPEVARRLILVGCPPLDAGYVEEITRRRLANLSDSDRALFSSLASRVKDDADMERLRSLVEKSDNYRLDEPPDDANTRPDGKMFEAVWGEAAELRRQNMLVPAFGTVHCPIDIIQGEDDPHPAAGVTVPLAEAGVPHEMHILKRCGHSPFHEKFARDAFYDIVRRLLAL